MKTLLLMRHAKSRWGTPELSDFDRPLNKRGRNAAPKMGRFLRAQGLRPDVVLVSSAVRARQTAEAVMDAAEFDSPIFFRPALYLASVEEHLDGLRKLQGDVDCVLVVGHNPGLEELVELLTGSSEFLPTASVAFLSLPIDSWEDLCGELRGVLESVWRPKELPDE